MAKPSLSQQPQGSKESILVLETSGDVYSFLRLLPRTFHCLLYTCALWLPGASFFGSLAKNLGL